MLRINLLPKEVLERRRFEGWYRYIFIIGTGAVLIVLLFAASLYLMAQQKGSDLQTARDRAKDYAAQGAVFDVFVKNEQEYSERQATVNTALAGRMNLGKIAEEVSLVLPDEVWVDSMSIDQKAGLNIAGNTPRSDSTSLNIAYKSVAKTLVRLNELPSVTDVWLASAANANWSAWDPSTVATSTPVVAFAVSAKLLSAADTTATSGSGK